MRAWIPFLLCDVALVCLFAALGRQQHEHGLNLLGIFATAAPFVWALLAMSLMTRFPHEHSRLWPQGVLVWLGTVCLGLGLRVLFGATAAPAFILVTALCLGVFLLGRRALTALILNRQRG